MKRAETATGKEEHQSIDLSSDEISCRERNQQMSDIGGQLG